MSDIKDAMHRGVLLILVRLGVAYLLCALFYLAFGYEGMLGISFLAFVCTVTSANAALYMGIISPFGDKADKASFGIMLICSMPLLHRPGYASVASGSLAGVALVIPSMAAASNTALEPYVEGQSECVLCAQGSGPV